MSGVDVVFPEETGEWSVVLVLTGGREVRMISPAMNYISPGPGVATLHPPPSSLLMVVTVTTFVWSFTLLYRQSEAVFNCCHSAPTPASRERI